MDEFEKELLNVLRGRAAKAIAQEAVATLDSHPLASWQVDFTTLFAGDHEDEQWLLEPIIAKGRAHALYAGAKVGKSYVMLYLAAALATGRAVLRRPAGTPAHVLYVDYEMTPSDLADRLEEFGYGPDDAAALNEHLHYVLLPSMPALDSDEGGNMLARTAVAVGAELVVIDTMMRALSGEENSADTFNAFYRSTGLRLKALGVAWARLDHAGKDPTKGQRGSSAKDGDVDLVLRLDRVEGGVEIKATHRRISWYPERTKLNVLGGDTVTMSLDTGDLPLWPAGTKEAADALDELGVPLEASGRAAVAAMKAAGKGMRSAVVRAGQKWRTHDLGRLLSHDDCARDDTGRGPGHMVETSYVDENGTRSGRTGTHPDPPAETNRDAVGTRGTRSTESNRDAVPPPRGDAPQDPPPSDTQEEFWT